MNVKELQNMVDKINYHKGEVEKNRNMLRGIYEDLATELESFDKGVDTLEEAKRCFLDAIDYLSEVV